MGLLVKTPPISVRRRSSNQDDEKPKTNRSTNQPTIDRSLLDRDTLNFLVCQVRHQHEKFPIAEKNRGRSKKRWKKIEKQPRRSKTKDFQEHKQGNTRCLDSERSGSSSSRSSHSSTSSTFSKIIGKLGQSRWASIASSRRNTRSDERSEKNDSDYHEQEKEGSRRRSFEDATVVSDDSSSIFDFDGDDIDQEVDAIFEIRSKIEDEELDPIFVSGLDDDSLCDISKSGSVMFRVHSGSLLDSCDDDESDDDDDDDESAAECVDSEIGDECVSGCQGIDDAVKKDESKDDPVSCSVIEFLEDREDGTIDILGRDIAAGEASNADETTMTRPSHTSRKQDPLWVRNQDRRNDLAWIRCAARNREHPMDFPIARKRRRKLVERKEESPIADMCDTWIFSCGDVFDL